MSEVRLVGKYTYTMSRSIDLTVLGTQRSVCPALEPNVFLSSPPTQSISEKVMIHARFYLETDVPLLFLFSVFLFLTVTIYYFC